MKTKNRIKSCDALFASIFVLLCIGLSRLLRLDVDRSLLISILYFVVLDRIRSLRVESFKDEEDKE